MKAAVAPTDERWAEFLAEHPEQTEANFWQPSATGEFRMLQVGEPFLFKTKSPKRGRRFDRWGPNQLVGGGFYTGYAQLSIAEAWDFYGVGNGVGSLDELVARIAHFRREPNLDTTAFIGCVLLRDLFFMPPDRALPQPADFASNLTRAKGYDLSSTGSRVDIMFASMLERSEVRVDNTLFTASERADPVRFVERLTRARLGQTAFQVKVLDSYARRCAITGNHIVPTLQAAHIKPAAEGGSHLVSNGLLLRSDVHTLFDRGFLGINGRHELQVSALLRQNWGNGQEFYDLAGHTIRVPEHRQDRPAAEAVEWHMDTVFLR